MTKDNLIGAWAFLIGVILAVIVGLGWANNQVIQVILVLLGLIIGLLNISDAEVKDFVLIGTALLIASTFGGTALSAIDYIGPVMNSLTMLVAPAIIIVALKAVFAAAKR